MQEGQQSMSRSRLTRRVVLQNALLGGAGLFLASCGSAAQAPGPSANGSQTSSNGSTGSVTTPSVAATSSGAAVSTSSATAAASAANVGGKPATITWWMASRGDDLLAFETSPKAYMQAHPGVTIQFSGDIAGVGGTPKIQSAIAAGSPPDLVQTSDYPGASGLYYTGAIPPIDDLIKASKDFDITTLEPATTAACKSYDGKQWALPDQLYVTSDLFYNTKLLQDKGLDPTKPPTTLEDLEKTAAMFDVRNGGQLVQVGFHPSQTLSPEIYAFAFGGKFWDPSKQKVTPNDPGVIAGLQWLVAYYQKYGVDNLRRLQGGYGQYQSAQNALLAGKVAFTGFWDAMVAYRSRYAPDVPIDMTWFPYPAAHPEENGVGTIGFNPTFIPKGTKQRDLAWDILRFNETDTNTVLQTSILLANTPESVAAIQSPGASKADPLLKKCWDYAAKGKMNIFPPSIPGNAQYSQEWKSQIDLIIGGKTTIQDGMQKIIDVVQPQVDKALKG
jgi:multiple sugar transport system substrate-binding protein